MLRFLWFTSTKMSYPYWFVLEFWKIKLENSSLMNWNFSLQKSILKWSNGSKNSVRKRLKIQFVERDFSKLIFQKSSTNQQGVSLLSRKSCYLSVLSSFKALTPRFEQKWWSVNSKLRWNCQIFADSLKKNRQFGVLKSHRVNS